MSLGGDMGLVSCRRTTRRSVFSIANCGLGWYLGGLKFGDMYEHEFSPSLLPCL